MDAYKYFCEVGMNVNVAADVAEYVKSLWGERKFENKEHFKNFLIEQLKNLKIRVRKDISLKKLAEKLWEMDYGEEYDEVSAKYYAAHPEVFSDVETESFVDSNEGFFDEYDIGDMAYSVFY